MNERLLREWIRESLISEGPALKSETYLADSITQAVALHGKVDPKSGKKYLEFTLGSFGSKKVVGATKAGGGFPEPKADVIISTIDQNIGVSMKAPNYDFIQSRMQKGVLKGVFEKSGADPVTIQKVIDGLIATCVKLASSYAADFTAQKAALISVAKSIDPNYSFPEVVWPEIKPLGKASPMGKALVASGHWRWHGEAVRSLTEIPTSETRSSLKDAIGDDAFNSFMTDIIAGGDAMPEKDRANAMLMTLVSSVTTDISEIQSYLSDITTIEQAVKYYSNAAAPPEMRLIYRSEAASRTSKTESGRYERTNDPLVATPSGTDNLKWTVSIVKGREIVSDSKIYLRRAIRETLLLEELTKADVEKIANTQIEKDRAEQKRIIKKEIESELKSSLGTSFFGNPGKVRKAIEEIVQDELNRSFAGGGKMKDQVADITKAVLKKMYREISHSYNPVIDRIRI